MVDLLDCLVSGRRPHYTGFVADEIDSFVHTGELLPETLKGKKPSATCATSLDTPTSRDLSPERQPTLLNPTHPSFGPQKQQTGVLLLVLPSSKWMRGQDLNLRPSGYEPDELPDCSTPHCLYCVL